MKKNLIAGLVVVLVIGTGIAWASLRSPYSMNSEMPADLQIRTGKLENGLTYYIRHNEQPKSRAEFYIIQNVGALLETDDQDGLAHFLEHMAFNGTQNFPDNTMISYLASQGVEFGRDINAYTGLSETVYNLSNVPTDHAGLVDSCLLILHDWSHFILLEDEQINKERGVILEEMRTNSDASTRMAKIHKEVMFEGSMYAKRDVIGNVEVLKTFQPETLRSFYHTWYRPDLQAIVVVGDVDVDRIEQQIKDLFASIPAVNGPKRPDFDIPDRSDVGYVCTPDKEANGSGVGMIMFRKKEVDNTHQGVMTSVVDMFYNVMLQNRIFEMLQQGSPTVVSATAGIKDFMRGYTSFQVTIQAKNNYEKEAFEQVYREIVRANKLGFTQSELDRYKKSVGAAIASNIKQLDKRSNRSYVGAIQNQFLNQVKAMDLPYYYEFMRWAAESVTLRQINKYAERAMDKKNCVFIVSGPLDGVKHVSKQELLDVMEQVEQSDLEPYIEEKQSQSELLDASSITPGTIVETRKLPLFNAEEWTLSNGARVVYAKATYDGGVVDLGAISKGGSSLYAPEMLPAVSVTSQIIGAFGVGEHTGMQLLKVLAGQKVSNSISITNLYEKMQFGADTTNIETMFQLAYMRFTQQLFEEPIFNTTMERTIAAMQGEQANPLRIVNDSVSKISSNYSPRSIIADAQTLKKIQLSDIEKIYKERFSDASDFLFILVGNVEAERAKQLVERYIASIPSTYSKESWRDNKDHSPRGKTVRVIDVPFETAKAIVSVNYLRDMPYTRSTSLYVTILKGILEQRLIENIRERESSTYSISVISEFERELQQRITIGIQFDCDPESAQRLKGLVYKELESLRRSGVTAAEVQERVKLMRKNRQQSLEHNTYVTRALLTYVQTGMDDTDPKNYDQILDRVTPADIRQLADQLFDDQADVIDLIFKSNS